MREIRTSGLMRGGFASEKPRRTSLLYTMMLGGLAFGLCSVCSAAMLELSNDTTWTDLSALEGYDGVTIAAGRTLTLSPASGTTMNFAKVIAGDGGLVKDGAGNLELRGANTFNGTCVIGGTGNVYAYSDTAFGSATGRTKHYQYLYTGGVATIGSLGANLYLCGITTDEGFDIISNGNAKYFYIASNTVNEVNGSVTISGSQTDIYVLSGGTGRFRGGISPVAGSGAQLRPSTESDAQFIIENEPLTCGMWNAGKANGLFLLSAPGNVCGYTFHPITLGCDWAFNGASPNWGTGGTQMKVDLNGYANRVSTLACAKTAMNGWVTSTGNRAFLYYKGTKDVSTTLPFRGKVGLFHEGNVTTTFLENTKSASDTTGELCVTNGTVAFGEGAAWPNVTVVTLSEKGRVTLTEAGQIGTKAVLDLSGDGLLTLPVNGSVTVNSLKLDGVWQAPGNYSAAQLNGHLLDNGATVTVTFLPRANWINVMSDETWDDAALAALGDAEGIYIYPDATLTVANTAAYVFNKPVAGAGTLVIDGSGRIDLNADNPEFDGDLHIQGSTATEKVMRSVYLNNGAFLGTTKGMTTVHLSKNDTSSTLGIDFTVNTSFATDENWLIKGLDSPGRFRGVAGTTVTFKGDVDSSGSQVSFFLESNSSYVFNKSFTGGSVSLSPATGAKIVFNCPCKATLFNSHQLGGVVCFNTTGNAPLGYFCCWANFGVDFAWDNVDVSMGMYYSNNVKLDLCGHPQRVKKISAYNSSRSLASCSYATDSTGAKTFLHVNTTENKDSRVYFTGTAGLYWENTGTVTFKDTTSTSHGDLVVAKGRVIFDTATWLTGDIATVKNGAVLEIKDATKFAFNHLVVENGGKVVMASGTLHACDVTLGTTTYPAGSSLTLSDYADYFETTDGALTCDGDYVIDVPGANVGAVQTVTLNVPAGKRRIVKTGGGTAYVKAGANLSPGASIVIKAGALGADTPSDLPVLFTSSVPSITVEDGGTLDISGHNYADIKACLNAAIVSIAGEGATASDGMSKVGAIWRWKRLGTEVGSQGNNLFKSIVLTADATVNSAIACGCMAGGTKVMNGHTLTKIGAENWYWGNKTTAGNFCIKNGCFVLHSSPELEGTSANFIRVEREGSLLFDNCLMEMKPVPHTLDWHSERELCPYNRFGRFAGPWIVSSNLTMTTSTTSNPEGSAHGRLVQEGPIVATNHMITLSSAQPILELTGTNRHEFGAVTVSGQMEVRNGATVEIHPYASGANAEVSLRQSIDDISYGLPAKLTISNATLTSARAATPAQNLYGNFVLSWDKNNASELNVQAGAVVTGVIMCAQKGLGVVKQSGGEFVARDQSGRGQGNFFSMIDASYGGFLLSGGRFVSDAALDAAMGDNSTAVIRQDGGEFVSGINGSESFNVGGGYFSFYQTGGVFTNASAISFGSYRTGTGSRREIGLTGSSTLQYHYWDIRVGNGTLDKTDTTVFHLADGATLDFRCFTYNRPETSARRFYLGSGGGVLRPHRSGHVFSSLLPDAFTLYADGVVVDTSDAGGDVTIAAALRKPTGKVVTGVTLPTDADYLAQANYLGPAKLTISGGSGAAATAVTVYDEATHTLSGVEIVSPGFGYQAGDTVTATVDGQFKTNTFACAVTLGDPDLSGGLTKRGANRLVMTGESDYNGVTRIEGGTLEFTAGSYPANSDVVITAEAVNAARASGTPALIVANFPTGRTVTLSGADTLDLSGLDRMIRLVSFTGTRPASVNLVVLDSDGAPYVLPDGNQFYFSGGSIHLGKPKGLAVIIR